MKLIPENIMSLDPSDERIQHCRVCMLTADCSHSGIMNPVNFLLTEDEGIFQFSYLKYYFKYIFNCFKSINSDVIHIY